MKLSNVLNEALVSPAGMGDERRGGKQAQFAFQNTSGKPIKLSNVSKGSFMWRPGDYFMVVEKGSMPRSGTFYQGYLQGKFKGYPKSLFRVTAKELKGSTKRVKV